MNERSRFITERGALIYAHWFVKGAYEPDDSVWLLDLNRPFPLPKSNVGDGIAIEIGREIYPTSKTSNVRHRISELRVSVDSQNVFFTDWAINEGKAQEVCFIGVNINDLNRVTTKHNCDPMTLAASERTPKLADHPQPENEPSPLRIAWEAQKQNLSRGSGINLLDSIFAGHQKDRIVTTLLISETGAVMSANIYGSTAEVRAQMQAVFRSWVFKPTLLNGRATKVHVQFETTLEDLSKKN